MNVEKVDVTPVAESAVEDGIEKNNNECKGRGEFVETVGEEKKEEFERVICVYGKKNNKIGIEN